MKNQYLLRLLFLLLSLAGLGSQQHLQAQTIRYVKQGGAGLGDGTSWANASADLQSQINAQGVQQVWVAAGTYKPTTTTGPSSRTISFAMKNGVAIYGGFPATGNPTFGDRVAVNPITGNPSSTTLSGDIGTAGDASDNSYHVIFNGSLDNTAVLDGFVITGGNANGDGLPDNAGGAMYNEPGSPTLTNCAFINNLATNGGAMYNVGSGGSSSRPTLTNCSFQSNTASNGGGAMLNAGSSPTLTNCAFLNNSASTNGGAMFNEGIGSYNSSPTLTNCSFQANSAISGGAMFNSTQGGNSSPTLTNCAFQSNSATNGGAMVNAGSIGGNSSPTLTNCAFLNNSASNRGGAMSNAGTNSSTSRPTLTNCSFQSNTATNGGAIYNNGTNSGNSSPILTNCSFQNNLASTNGGAMVNDGSNSGNSNPTLTNCVLFGNGGGNTIYNIPNASVSASYSLFENGVTGFTNTGNNITGVTTSPFASTASTQLSACSPAINAGTNSATGLTGITTDLAGNPRFYNNGTVDMGAYEYQGAPNSPVAITSQPAAGSSVCVGSTVTASVSVSGTVSGYQWYNASGVVTGQTAATLSLSNVQVSNAGSYSVVVMGACNSGTPAALTSTAFSVTVNALPTNVSLTSNGPLTCAQTSVTLTASGGNSYTFTNPGGSVLAGSGNTRVISSPGSYSVTVANASGCVSSTSTTVVSNTATITTANPATSTATVGVGFSQTFTATSTGVASRTFALASGTLPTGLSVASTGVLSGTPTQSGNFAITVRATDTNGCFADGPTYTLVVSPAVVVQPIRYVKQGGAGLGDGTSWANASADLQSQINAQGVQQVWVAAGTYKPTTTTGPSSRTISFAMKNGVAIYGGFPATGNPTFGDRVAVNPITGNPSSTTLSGDIGTVGDASDNSYHVISNGSLDNTAVLDGFVITGGNANGGSSGNNNEGGAMYNYGSGGISSPTLTNCSFQSNSATNGGAMFNDGSFGNTSSPTLTNCSFQTNSASQQGGAMYNSGIFGSSSPTLTNCSFQNNSASDGGAINNFGLNGISSPTLTNCAFQNNSASTYGGAMYNYGSGGISSPTLTNCSFQTNSASNGGAMYNLGAGGTSSPTLTNCSFLNNSATQQGGAMYNDGSLNGSSRPTLTNCSFLNNSASNGGAMYNDGSFGTSSPILTNCALFGNGGGNTIYNTLNASVSASYSLFENGVIGFADNGNNITGVTTSPFASTASTQLSACSPAINKGTNSATGLTGITTDLAGNPRFYNNGTVDMGAYEYQGTPNFPVAITSQPAAGSAVCVGGTVTASVSVSGTVSGYQWYNASGVVTGQTAATLLLTNVQPSNAGSYSVVVTGACNSGTPAALTSTAFSVTVNASPTNVGLTNNGPLTCAQTSVTLTASGGNSYTFTNPGGSVLAGSGNTRVVSSPGTYSVTVANASGCVSSTSTTVASTTATITTANPATSTATVGLGFSQSFTATSTGVASRTFALASGTLPTGLSVASTGVLSGTPTQSGSFAITVRATDTNGCFDDGPTYTLVVSPAVVVQAIRYVKQGGAGLGDGTSWANASADLQSQINAQGVQQVWVAAGTYKPTTTTGPSSRSISFAMKNGVAIYGGFPATGNPAFADRVAVNPITGSPSSSTLSGDIGTAGDASDNSYHVINNGSLNNTAVLDGFVITGGNANGGGNNNRGGAMFNVGAFSISSPTLTNCAFQSNSADTGGAMYNYGNSGTSSPTLTNCAFLNNSASSYGGAMYNDGLSGGSNPTLTNCAFLNNSASNGGAMYNVGNNNGNSSPILTNCSFQNNLASTNGGAMLNFNVSGTSSPTLANCALFGNGGGNTIFDLSASVSASYSLFDVSVTNYTGSTNLTTTTSPFASTASTQLSACSPAINAGNPASVTVASGPYSATALPATDLAGNPRLVGGRVDMGAYEFQGTPNSPVAITSQPAAGSSVCVGSTVTASVSVSGTVSGYQWYNASGVVTGQTAATFSLTNVQPSDAGSYSVVVTGACNAGTPAALTSTAFSLTVNALPTNVSLTSNGPLTCAQTSVTLTASGGNSYTFTNPGGSVLAGSGNTRVISSPGSYSVTVANASGCLSSTSTTVVSNTATITTANPATSTATVGVGFSQTFTATSTGVASRTFALASGTLPTGLSVASTGVLSGTPTQSGSFAITVRATDTNGCFDDGPTYTLVVSPATPTIAGFAVVDNTVCVGSPISFTATVGNVSPPYAFTLTNGTSSTTGNANSTAFSQNLTASGSGLQTFTLTVNDGGLSATATKGVTVNAVPAAPTSLVATPSTVCSGSITTLTASGCAGTLSWFDAADNSAVSSTPTITANKSFYAKCAVGGCTSVASSNVNVTVVTPLASSPGNVGINWTGLVSTDWNTACNWDPAWVPDATNSAVVIDLQTNQPTITGPVPTVNQIYINSNATLTVNSGGTLNANSTVAPITLQGGNIINDGTINLSGGGTGIGISIQATASVTNRGTITTNNLFGISLEYGNLTFTNESTGIYNGDFNAY